MMTMNTRDGRPLVVLDRCVLSFRRVEKIVPLEAAFVLTDTFFHEAATADPVREGPKFNTWAKRFAGRLFFAQYWDELSREESAAGKYVDAREIMHEAYSRALRQEVRDNGLDWTKFVDPEFQSEVAAKEKRVNDFVELCEVFSRTAHERHPDWKNKLSCSEQVELIRQPGFVASFVQERNPSKSGEDWQQALSVFPDRHAISRWARLVAWYAIQHSVGKTKGFKNNYYDAEYAFAASYVGRLATTDGRLKEAVGAVFPEVSILSD